MFASVISFAALALPLHSLNTAFAQDPGTTQAVTQLREDQIGLTLFQPRHSSPRDLIGYAKDLTESTVQFMTVNSATGQQEIRQRGRFIPVANSIGVQGDDAGRKEGVAFLTEIDEFIGKSRVERTPELATLVRTVRLRSMSVGAAAQLLAGMATNVEMQMVAEAGTIVLRGATEAVARAESLLLEVDKPAPQMTMHVTLIEAVDGAPTKPVTGDLGKALAGLMPGKQFQQAARFMVRGSVAGNAPLEISSSFGEHVDAKARFMFQARSRSWDAERKVLTLGGCEVHSERPKFMPQPQQTTIGPAGLVAGTNPGATAPGTQAASTAPGQVLSGYDKEGFTTDLSLNQGQDTVVGSLGGNALLIVLHFTVDASVN